MRRVLLPLLYPAIFVSAVLVFADVIDDFVIVRALSADVSTEPMSVKIYNSARSSPSNASPSRFSPSTIRRRDPPTKCASLTSHANASVVKRKR